MTSEKAHPSSSLIRFYRIQTAVGWTLALVLFTIITLHTTLGWFPH